MRSTVTVLALGGTIAMTATAQGEGAAPALDAAGLVATVPRLAEVADVRSETVANVPSASVTVADVLAVLGRARRAARAGCAGVVVTHGTDTLEETAYLLDLLWDRPEPLVVTGAMRTPDQPGADGPANLLAAAVTASSPSARGLGAVVVLGDELHLARHVTKADAVALTPFRSPGWGPAGRVVEGRLRVAYRPARRFEPLASPGPGPVRVPVVEAVLDDDASTFRAVLTAGPPAVVLAATGSGSVSVPVAEACSEARAAGTPVVLASRTGSGPLLERTYGYPGSARDLVARGVLPAGSLTPRRARLLTHVLLAAGSPVTALRDELAARGA